MKKYVVKFGYTSGLGTAHTCVREFPVSETKIITGENSMRVVETVGLGVILLVVPIANLYFCELVEE